MQINEKAIEFINPGETAVVVFTHGDNLRVDPQSGDGESGNRKITPDALDFVNRVIVYLRRTGEPANHVLVGDFSGFRMSEEPGRVLIRFTTLKEVSLTNLNWFEFCENSQNPVCIITK